MKRTKAERRAERLRQKYKLAMEETRRRRRAEPQPQTIPIRTTEDRKSLASIILSRSMVRPERS
jgi:hypothetical protein